jgi:hypothetical protein
LRSTKVTQPELILASKVKFPREEALELARDAKRVLVSQRKKLLAFDASDSDNDIASAILGRSGNLRVPSIRIGDTLMVGFHEEAYQQLFG